MTPPNMIMPNHFPMQELEFPSTSHPGANLKNATLPGIVTPNFSSTNIGIQDDDQVGTNNYEACFSYPSQVMLRDDSTAGRPRNSFSQHASQIPDFSNPSQMQGPVTMDSGRGDITEVGTQLLVGQFLMVPRDDLRG
ncbi:hypothetical protein TIFTF001_021257 [Ficus carica]|uniref:Uncharacterized protein n=1 Tax=Ficus carica TaxID=3494 RepID=A0AA88ACC5_FICCA|nr:hypothetical protein TIFTF001_021257 [Ficus carica]